jgi:hypothetical protein
VVYTIAQWQFKRYLSLDPEAGDLQPQLNDATIPSFIRKFLIKFGGKV